MLTFLLSLKLLVFKIQKYVWERIKKALRLQ